MVMLQFDARMLAGVGMLEMADVRAARRCLSSMVERVVYRRAEMGILALMMRLEECWY